MKKYIYIIGIALLTVSVLPSFSQVSNDNEDEVNKIDTRWAKNDFVPGQVLVKFKDASRVQVNASRGQFRSTSIDRVTHVLQKYGTDEMEQLLPNENPNRKMRRAKAYNGDVIQERDLSQLYLVKLSADHLQETTQMVDELNAIDEVEYAEPNYYCYIMGGECIAESYGTNPMVSKQWYLDAYGVTELWDKPIVNGERPVIAIIDTGVDTTHPDLKDNCIEGYDFVNNTANVIDDNMHGTHVAGIAAACNNGTGIVGANPLSLIMPIKVMDKNGRGNTATILQGVNYAVEHGAKILNLSLGGYGYSKAAADVYRNASTQAIIVAAAGNDSKCIYASHAGMQKHGIQPEPSFPGGYSFVLGVQATTRKGVLASFSNYDDDGPLFSCEASLDEPDGFNYELKAPGTEIYSTLPNGNYGELQGTSMASPLVAGAISALMMVKNYESQERLWAELLHTNNVAEAYALTELQTDLDVVRMMLRERKEFSDETEEAYNGINEVNAGETIELYPVIRCLAGEASNIKLKLDLDENEDPNVVEIVSGEVDFGWHLDAMGKAVSKNPLVFRIPEGIADSRHIRMKVIVSCENQVSTNSRSFTFLANNMETISGILAEDVTLHTGHTYYVDDDLIVNAGVTLTIEPGTRLEFREEKALMSNGKLVANGTIGHPIVFTSHHVGEKWRGIMTRKKSGGKKETGLYTNDNQTLFTLSRTDVTPNPFSSAFTVRYYNPSSVSGYSKSFYLIDYVDEWDSSKNLLDNVYGDEALLKDPNFLTPAVLRMLEDYNNFVKSGTAEYGGANTRQMNVSTELLSWQTYADYGDTISYCWIDNSKGENNYVYETPYMRDCMISNGYLHAEVHGFRCVVTEMASGAYLQGNRYGNIANYSFGSLYSSLIDCNFFNSSLNYWLSARNDPGIDYAKYPSYLGTSREDIVRPHVYELGNSTGEIWGVVDLGNMRKTPVTEAHGIVWKVLVNGKDAQDEYEELAPLGVGRHKFEVYFNRPMNKAVIPQISFGVRDPWTQNGVDEDGYWNEEGTVYTAYKTITGKTNSDGVNRIYVRGAEDDEFFPCPYEKTRFNITIQAAGSMATGFAAEASVGRVKLIWDNSENDFEDAMGFNVYRFSDDVKKTIPGHYDDKRNWIEPKEVPDTIRINENILGIETSEYVDYDVVPNHTYYYLYKVLSTDLKEYDISNIVAATPLTATLGDANGNGDVDVADVITTVNYVVGMKPNPFVFDAADINADKNIDVLDVIGIVQKVLYPNGARVESVEEYQAVYTVENGILYVESPVALAGVQTQLSLDGRGKMEDVKVAQELDGFEQASAWLTDNDYLFMAYSMSGKTLAPGKHALLYIGDANLSSLRLSDMQGHNVTVVAGEGTTKVDAMGSKVMTAKGIYNLNGQKLNSDKLRKGIYIIDGIKVVK